MSVLNHLNELEYNDANEQKVKVQLHDGKLYFQIRDDATGDFDTPRVIQDKDILIIKDMYGGNGNERNLCLKFALHFADARPYELLLTSKQEIQKLITAEAANEVSILTELILDSSAGGDAGINLVFTLSYDPNDEINLKTGAAATLLTKLQNPTNLQAMFTNANITNANFKTNVTLVTRDDIVAKILHKNVPGSIMKVTLTNVGAGTDTKIDVLPVGNWDHWGVKYDTATVTQNDNDIIRIRDGTLTHTYSGIDANSLTKLYVTLFDRDYQPLYTFENTVATAAMVATNATRRSVKHNYY
jgi:hypothetical protein